MDLDAAGLFCDIVEHTHIQVSSATATWAVRLGDMSGVQTTELPAAGSNGYAQAVAVPLPSR